MAEEAKAAPETQAAPELQTLPTGTYGEAPTALDYRPADATLVTNSSDLGAGSECQLGNGRNAPAGTTNYGFTDTTYTPTTAQVLRQTTTGQT
jgi:hypothetical protein